MKEDFRRANKTDLASNKVQSGGKYNLEVRLGLE